MRRRPGFRLARGCPARAKSRLQRASLHGSSMPLRFAICRNVSWVLLALAAGMPALAHAAATAQGVALNVNAAARTADLDLTLTTVGATREFGQATNLAGATLTTFEQATRPSGHSAARTRLRHWPRPRGPAGAAARDADRFLRVRRGRLRRRRRRRPSSSSYYNCSTRQVLLSCFGPYGTCPKTALQAQSAIPIPALDKTGLALAMLLLALSALFVLRRRS